VSSPTGVWAEPQPTFGVWTPLRDFCSPYPLAELRGIRGFTSKGRGGREMGRKGRKVGGFRHGLGRPEISHGYF